MIRLYNTEGIKNQKGPGHHNDPHSNTEKVPSVYFPLYSNVYYTQTIKTTQHCLGILIGKRSVY